MPAGDEGRVEATRARREEQVDGEDSAPPRLGKYLVELLRGHGVPERVQNDGEASRPAEVLSEGADGHPGNDGSVGART